MNIKKIYRVPANALKRNLEGDRPDAPSIEGGEGRDYNELDLHFLGLIPNDMSAMGLMSAPAPVVKIPSLEEIVKFHKKKLLWYPWATKVAAIKHRGSYNDGYPVGGIYHYNAGGNSPVATMEQGRKNGYLYSACGRFGEHVQSNPFSQWGYHAGSSSKVIGGKRRSGVSAYLHGVEVSSAGLVTAKGNGKFAAYFHKKPEQYFDASQVRQAGPIPNELRGGGWFHRYEQDQELSMERFWLFMKVNNPDVFRLEQIFAHSEVATPFGRKVDCGGSLSMSMDAYRTKLLKAYDTLNLK